MLRILLDWDYEIFEADDGSTANEMLIDNSFDLVIMDIRMPKVSGLEALHTIKTLNLGKKLLKRVSDNFRIPLFPGLPWV